MASAQDAAEQSCRRVERRVKIGTASRLNAALLASEDSETLNTSFIERLNSRFVKVGVLAPALAMPRSWRRPASAGTSSSCGATTISFGRTGR